MWPSIQRPVKLCLRAEVRNRQGSRQINRGLFGRAFQGGNQNIVAMLIDCSGVFKFHQNIHLTNILCVIS